MVGEYDISAVVHGGRLHVFYFDLIDSNLRHASFDGTTWAFEVVEGSIVSGGFPTTLGPQVSAVSDGTNLHVFYARSGGATAGGETFHLRHAKHDGTNWQIETLDGTGCDDGRILAPVGWAVTTIPETIYTGTPTGRIFVFYSESVLEGDVFPTHTNLRLAWWDATTSRWRFATLDGAGGLNGRTRARVGGTSAAVIHENEVHVFYHDATYSNLRHGWATVGDLDYWQFQALDGTGGLHGRVKSEIGLARMAAAAFADQISVFYWDATRHNLRHAWWKGAGTSWLFETLDGDGGAQGRIEADIRGAVAAMNLTGSLFSGVGVFYYDHTNTDLRFASFS